MLKNNNPKHELTQKEKSKGGKAKSLIKSLNRRKHCNKTCPLYPCVLAPLAMASPERLCALKQANAYYRKTVFELILGGPEGAVWIYKNLIAKMILTEDSRDSLKALDRSIRTVYGEKQQIESKSEDTITIEDIKNVFRKRGKNEQDKRANKD